MALAWIHLSVIYQTLGKHAPLYGVQFHHLQGLYLNFVVKMTLFLGFSLSMYGNLNAPLPLPLRCERRLVPSDGINNPNAEHS